MKKITVLGCGVIGLTTAITLERAGYDPKHFFYIIPRRDCVVLGGSAEPHNYNLQIDDALTQAIFDRTQKVDPKIKKSNLVKVETGLRPYRSEIRLEKAQNRNIIHNYGHGGSGFTVSWGCAQKVLEIIEVLKSKA